MVKEYHDKVGVSFFIMGVILVITGVLCILFSYIKMNSISEEGYPIDIFAFSDAIMLMVGSVVLLIFGIILTVGALVRLSIISGRTILILVFILIVISFIFQIKEIMTYYNYHNF